MNTKNSSKLIHKIDKNDATYQEFRTALTIIGDNWSGLILFSLFNDIKRFTDIEEACPGLNPRTLTKKLRMLEDKGLISRHVFKEFPPRTEYTPTQKAHDLKEALMELKKWAKKYCHEKK